MSRQSSPPADASATPVSVLYADADAARAERVAASLERHSPHFDVVTELSPTPDAVRVGLDAVDCVVAVHGPETDGLELLDVVRSNAPVLPFVLVATPDADAEAVATDAIAAGVTNYLREPADDGSTLAAAVSAALDADAGARGGRPDAPGESAVADSMVADSADGASTAETAPEMDAALLGRALDEAELGVTIAPADGDTRMTYVNEGFTRITGYDTAEARGRNCRFLQGPETDERAVETLRRAVAARESETVTLRNYRKDGEPFWNQVDITPVTDDDGRVSHFIGFQRDVTERKRLAQELEASETSLRALYRAATDTSLSFAERLERTLEIGCSRLGLSLGFLTDIDDVDGIQTVTHVVGDHPLLQPDSACPLSEAYCRRTIETEGLVSLIHAAEEFDGPAYERFGLESYVGGKVIVDGELHGTLCFADTEPRTEPFTASEGAFVEVLTRWVSYELERRAHESALRTAKRRFRSLFDNPLTFAAVLDESGTVVEMNDTAAATLDADVETIIGRRFWETRWWTPSDESVETVREAVDAAAAGETSRFECEYFYADGVGTVSATLYPVRTAADAAEAVDDGDDADLVSLLAVGYDVTTRTEQADRIREQRDRLDEFASVVSHDLRNPLEVARGRLDLYRTGLDGTVDADGDASPDPEHLRSVERALDRMDALVDDLLSLARQGDVVETPDAVAVDEVAAAAWSTVATAGATFEADTALVVDGDASRLRQLFENLFRNAIDHGRADASSTLSVRVAALPDGGGFAVEDDGVGIPEADRDTVFEHGYTTDREGTGFGLAIVRRILDAHGWTVSVTESETGGARFEISVDDGVTA